MGLIEEYKNGKRYGTDWQAPSFQHMNDLVGAASNAQDNAIAANTKATTAESNSSNALQKATTAETNSTNAVNTANTANTKSDNANTTANDANAKSDSAVTTANSANTKATNAETTVTNLTQAPDVTEADKFGVVKVEFIGTGTNKKFKFSNLKGNGIVNVTKTSTNNLVDTYTITFDNAKTSNFNVTNGDSIEMRVADGYFQWKYTEATTWNNLISVGELSNVDQELSTTSTNAVQNKVVTNAINTAQNTANGAVKTTDLLNLTYPIGSIYLSVGTTSPASLFGGVWEKINDRFLLGAGDTFSLGSTGGEINHTLSTQEMPTHTHKVLSNNYGNANANGFGNGTGVRGVSGVWTNGNETKKYYLKDNNENGQQILENTGGSTPHNNMPPYFVVNIWKRVS